MHIEYYEADDIMYILLSDKKMVAMRSNDACTMHFGFDEDGIPVCIEISPVKGQGLWPILEK